MVQTPAASYTVYWWISEQVHTDMAPFPYFPFRSPEDSLSHLLWDTFPLSSPLCLLHLPQPQQSLEEFCFVCQDKSKQKAQNKGRMLGVNYLCQTLAGHHPAKQLSHGPLCLVPLQELTNNMAGDSERAGGQQGWAGPRHPTQECLASQCLQL